MTPAHDLELNPPQSNYLWQWAVLIAVVVVGFIYVPRFLAPSGTTRFVTSPGVGTADWFLVARLPEAPSDPQEVKQVRDRLDQWLSALANAGFHPIRLSDALERRLGGARLPEKSLVLVYEPGFRTTYEAFAPVLAKHGFPATWITREDRVKAGDFRYASRHAIRLMLSSGLWDVAMRPDAKSPFQLLPEKNEDAVLPAVDWLNDGSRRARNRLSEMGALHRVIIQPDWAPEQVLDQLEVEVPIEGSSYLHVRELGGRLQALATDGSIPARFDLSVPNVRRVSEIWWPSTQGYNHVAVELSLEDLSGELWIFLRSDEKTGDGIRVGISKGFVSVVSRTNGQQRQIAVFHPNWIPGELFRFRAVLLDNTLRLYANDKLLSKLDNLPDPFSREAKFGMMIYDRIRGSASAKNVTILFTPLSKDLIKTIESLSTGVQESQEEPSASPVSSRQRE